MTQRVPAIVFAVALAACASDPAGSAASKNSVVVFHTATAVLAVEEKDIEATRHRAKIDSFYPAACVDRDDDDDGIPNSHDHHARGDDDDDHDGGVDDDDHRDAGPGDDDDHDGGVDDDHDGGVDDDDDDDRSPLEESHGCSRCNSGPGTAGDFRLEIRGTEVKLDRATVASVEGGTLTVASPEGAIRILVGSGTEIDDGTPTPGAEIRVEGVGVRDAAGALTITAERIEVLCAGPTPMPAGEVPPEARPIPVLD